MKTTEAIRLLKPYTIWVLAPHLESEDPNLSYYYDFTQSIAEYTKVFEELKAEWKCRNEENARMQEGGIVIKPAGVCSANLPGLGEEDQSGRRPPR